MKDRERPDQFIKDALALWAGGVVAPDPATDYGMYEKMDAAFAGLHEYLGDLMRNQGRIGYSAQNFMSDLTKAEIQAAQRGDETELMYIDRAKEVLLTGFDDAVYDGELAESANKFSRTMWQEHMEGYLFGRIWPIITTSSDSVPDLISWKDFKGNVQAYLYGYLDVVSELSKALADEFSKPDMTTEREFETFERYLAVADSIALRLSQERHIPNYVISNGFGRFMAYTHKLHGVTQTIAHVRRDYNLRRSIRRMVQGAVVREIAGA